MSDLAGLLNEAEKLGILDIDVTGGELSPAIIRDAIEATKHLNSRLDKKVIVQKLRQADGVAAG
jgi:TRAP-type mannitol/chloroaromatic compound transport system substrate-binding protein